MWQMMIISMIVLSWIAFEILHDDEDDKETFYL